MAKNKLPKKIAGVRVPKAIRKSPLMKSLLGSEMGRQVLANAITAGAAAAATALAHKYDDEIADAGKTARKGVARGGNIAARAVKDATGAMAAVIADAAKSVLPDDEPRRKSPRRKAGRERVTH